MEATKSMDRHRENLVYAIKGPGGVEIIAQSGSSGGVVERESGGVEERSTCVHQDGRAGYSVSIQTVPDGRVKARSVVAKPSRS